MLIFPAKNAVGATFVAFSNYATRPLPKALGQSDECEVKGDADTTGQWWSVTTEKY